MVTVLSERLAGIKIPPMEYLLALTLGMGLAFVYLNLLLEYGASHGNPIIPEHPVINEYPKLRFPENTRKEIILTICSSAAITSS